LGCAKTADRVGGFSKSVRVDLNSQAVKYYAAVNYENTPRQAGWWHILCSECNILEPGQPVWHARL